MTQARIVKMMNCPDCPNGCPACARCGCDLDDSDCIDAGHYDQLAFDKECPTCAQMVTDYMNEPRD